MFKQRKKTKTYLLFSGVFAWQRCLNWKDSKVFTDSKKKKKDFYKYIKNKLDSYKFVSLPS